MVSEIFWSLLVYVVRNEVVGSGKHQLLRWINIHKDLNLKKNLTRRLTCLNFRPKLLLNPHEWKSQGVCLFVCACVHVWGRECVWWYRSIIKVKPFKSLMGGAHSLFPHLAFFFFCIITRGNLLVFVERVASKHTRANPLQNPNWTRAFIFILTWDFLWNRK